MLTTKLQEVDRLSKRIPPITAKGYSYTYTNGPMKKRHGLMIIYKDTKLAKVQERAIAFDECCLRDPPSPEQEEETPEVKTWRRGRSRETSNLGLIVALQKNSTSQTPGISAPPAGYIVATCHLYWHPKHFYERARYGLPDCGHIYFEIASNAVVHSDRLQYSSKK